MWKYPILFQLAAKSFPFQEKRQDQMANERTWSNSISYLMGLKGQATEKKKAAVNYDMYKVQEEAAS